MTDSVIASAWPAALMPSLAGPQSLFVEAVSFCRGKLSIQIARANNQCRFPFADVLFDSVIGYRVLDERDLQTFWSACTSLQGWMFEIHANGWLQEELRRPGSCMNFYNQPREWLIPGLETCVSVLSEQAPEVHLSA